MRKPILEFSGGWFSIVASAPIWFFWRHDLAVMLLAIGLIGLAGSWRRTGHL